MRKSKEKLVLLGQKSVESIYINVGVLNTNNGRKVFEPYFAWQQSFPISQFPSITMTLLCEPTNVDTVKLVVNFLPN